MPPRWRFKRHAIVATVLVATVIWLLRAFRYEDADVDAASNTPFLLKYISPPRGKGGGKI